MNKAIVISLALCVVSLSACNKSPSDKLADRVESAADKRADALENSADALDSRAAEVRATGKQRANAIDAANRNVAAMTQEQRDAIVSNEAPAVR
ncbi:MAG: hypothetical protein ABIT04_03665 [Novosphingobium sp.]